MTAVVRHPLLRVEVNIPEDAEVPATEAHQRSRSPATARLQSRRCGPTSMTPWYKTGDQSYVRSVRVSCSCEARQRPDMIVLAQR